MAQGCNGHGGNDGHFLLDDVSGAGFRSVATTIIPLIVLTNLHIGLEHGVNFLYPPVPSIVIERVLVSPVNITRRDGGGVQEWSAGELAST